MVVAQAQRIDVEGHTVTFVFGPSIGRSRLSSKEHRPWLEEAASQIAGKKMSVVVSENVAAVGAAVRTSAASEPAERPRSGAPASDSSKDALKERALSDTGVQTMLDVFAAEIKDVEEM